MVLVICDCCFVVGYGFCYGGGYGFVKIVVLFKFIVVFGDFVYFFEMFDVFCNNGNIEIFC